MINSAGFASNYNATKKTAFATPQKNVISFKGGANFDKYINAIYTAIEQQANLPLKEISSEDDLKRLKKAHENYAAQVFNNKAVYNDAVAKVRKLNEPLIPNDKEFLEAAILINKVGQKYNSEKDECKNLKITMIDLDNNKEIAVEREVSITSYLDYSAQSFNPTKKIRLINGLEHLIIDEKGSIKCEYQSGCLKKGWYEYPELNNEKYNYIRNLVIATGKILAKEEAKGNS